MTKKKTKTKQVEQDQVAEREAILDERETPETAVHCAPRVTPAMATGLTDRR